MNIESGHIIITVLVLIVLAMGWLFVLNTQELQELKALQCIIHRSANAPSSTANTASGIYHNADLDSQPTRPSDWQNGGRGGHAVVSDC